MDCRTGVDSRRALGSPARVNRMMDISCARKTRSIMAAVAAATYDNDQIGNAGRPFSLSLPSAMNGIIGSASSGTTVSK